jgi:hypothetical protein
MKLLVGLRAPRLEWEPIIIALVLLTLLALWLRPDFHDIPESVGTSCTPWRSGDILYFMEHGLRKPWPGHLAIVIQGPRYGQMFCFEMPNPLFHGPDLLKPLHRYLRSCMSKKKALVFRQELMGPPARYDFTREIRAMAAKSHFDMTSAVRHFSETMESTFLLPGLPDLPLPEGKNLFYCSTAVLHLLVKAGVLSPEILRLDCKSVIKPSRLLHPDFQINRYAQRPWFFGPLVRVDR